MLLRPILKANLPGVFKKVDLYLIKTYLSLFLVCLAIVSSLFLFIDVVSTINRFSVEGSVFVAYYFNYLPWVVTQMQPIAGVLATVFLFVGLQKNRELIIFHALGLSIYRVLLPILLMLFCLSFLAWALTDYVVPDAMEKRNYYYYVKMKNQPGSYNKLKKSNVWFRTPEAIINFGRVVSEDKVEDINVYFFDREKWRPTKVITAATADLKVDQWIYNDGVETVYSKNKIITSSFKVYETKSLESLKEFKKRQSQLNSMSLGQISFAIKKAKEASMSTLKLRTEYHGKLSFIFSSLFLSLLVLPFCLGNPRSSNAFIGMGVALFSVLGYWIFYSTMLNLGNTGALSPVIAGWLPGFVCTLVFLFFIRRQVT